MKLTLIRPNIGRLEDGDYIDEGRMEPLPLLVIAALTPPDVDVLLWDERIEPIPFDEPTDLVGISVEIYTARRAYEIAAEYRRRGVKVVLGGFHPTLAPGECLAHADAIVQGDAESVWAHAVEDARRGALRRVYRGIAVAPQAGGLMPRRDLLRGKRYLPVTLVQLGRGCRFACDFCAISAFSGRSHAARPVRDVIAEIERQERRTVFFVDDNIVANHDVARRLMRELIPLRIRWVSQASLDMTDDPELMDLMEASGCLGHVIGFESVDPRNLESMHKRHNLVAGGWDGYSHAIEVLRRHHLQTWAAFTVGHDFDTPASLRELLAFAMHHRFCFAAFNTLMPYPGTPFYDRLAREGRLLFDGRWWLHSGYRVNHAAFVPRLMSPDELTAACWDCRRRWNRPSSILRRAWDPLTHMSSLRRLGVYLGYNALYARETLKKQGMRLGLHEDPIPAANSSLAEAADGERA